MQNLEVGGTPVVAHSLGALKSSSVKQGQRAIPPNVYFPGLGSPDDQGQAKTHKDE
ncbi:hypothetical protein O9992_08995 [Vibrio lentus]|nr:hypothetical protein [Vibrio lentus]